MEWEKKKFFKNERCICSHIYLKSKKKEKGKVMSGDARGFSFTRTRTTLSFVLVLSCLFYCSPIPAPPKTLNLKMCSNNLGVLLYWVGTFETLIGGCLCYSLNVPLKSLFIYLLYAFQIFYLLKTLVLKSMWFFIFIWIRLWISLFLKYEAAFHFFFFFS